MVSLYRHFGIGSKLLYVGISYNALHRLCSHASNSTWYEEIIKVEIEHYPSLRLALDAEKKAIETENPSYNKNHKPGGIKKSSRRVTEKDVTACRLVVAEREDIATFYHKRFTLEWIADHFATTVDIIKYVLFKEIRTHPGVNGVTR